MIEREIETDNENEPIKPVKPERFVLTPKYLAIIVFVLILLVTTFVGYRRYYLGSRDAAGSDQTVRPTKKTILKQSAKKVADSINGELVPEDQAKNYPIAVMIENHPDARPQSGLVKAQTVYEAITEGGITRFMALFDRTDVKEIGPVRSARTFFIDWASEYKAYYAHAGGAPDALIALPKSKVYDLPHTNGYFVRKDRGNVASEHTLFTDTESLYRLAKVKKYPTSINVSPLKYKDEAALDSRGTQVKITINFSSDSYVVGWAYDKEKNTYARELGGVAHKDRTTGEQIMAKVIVVQEVARQDIQLPGAKATFKFTTTGTGKAAIYQDGKSIVGTWKKANQAERTKFYDSDNKEIELNRGTVWYEIVPPGTPISAS